MQNFKRNENDYIGVGWTFPPTFDKCGGKLKTYRQETLIESSIRMILSTAFSERIANPEFGCDLNEVIFYNKTTGVRRNIISRVEMALLTYEPRIDVMTVDTLSENENSGQIQIYIDYKIRNTNTRYNLVFPLYLDEANF